MGGWRDNLEINDRRSGSSENSESRRESEMKTGIWQLNLANGGSIEGMATGSKYHGGGERRRQWRHRKKREAWRGSKHQQQ